MGDVLQWAMFRAVCLSYELAEILDALRGVRSLIEPLHEPVEGPERIQAVASTLSGLTLTTTRLKQVVEVVRGEADPRSILESHNGIPKGFRADPEVLLKPWTNERVAAQAQNVLEMAERRASTIKRSKQRRKTRVAR
jgi:hypothetical protein